MPMTETSGDDAAEECSTPVKGKKILSLRQNGEEEQDENVDVVILLILRQTQKIKRLFNSLYES